MDGILIFIFLWKNFSMVNEAVVIVSRDVLMVLPSISSVISGFIPYSSEIEEKIISNKKLQLRSDAESDERNKQIIPYMIFCYDSKIFLMQYGIKSSAKTLSKKYTLGIGGHLWINDISPNVPLVKWGRREFDEEVFYFDDRSEKIIGFVNDDSNPVGRVHFGVVICVYGKSPAISIRSEMVWGKLIAIEEAVEFFTGMDNWTKIIYTYLCNNPSLLNSH